VISVDKAQAAVLALARPTGVETVPITRAAGRVLAAAVVAAADQPPFDAAAMDGWAVAGPVGPGDRLPVIGAARAGAAFAGRLAPGSAIRIATGAPVPAGTTGIVIAEDASEAEGLLVLGDRHGAGPHVRPRAGDFAAGFAMPPGRRLRPVDVALLAAMQAGRVSVRARPVVAILPTGDELVMPGEPAGPAQIACSNTFALAAMAEAEGAEARLLPIARDDPEAVAHGLALAAGADLVVTVGGASVGEHDLVRPVAERQGMALAFYRVAMRPGKPLQAGRLGTAAFLGLPGNPVSAIICGILFMLPLLRAMQGLPAVVPPRPGVLGCDLPANGPRAHYMRARRDAAAGAGAGAGLPVLTPFADQDSSRLRLLAEADALVLRPESAPAARAGDPVAWLPL
jgi:molybdopterin molybdotransferase